jgi:2-amino-4-hydroxy-6-hydroxymethyldihydropteridine diphosphokinase
MAIYLALGSNLGDRAATLDRAVHALAQRGISEEARSSLYETPPLGIPSRRPFLNAVVRVRSRLDMADLLRTMIDVERQLGRRRDHPDGDRTCDLDLLLVGDLVCREPALTLPHPRIRERRFVLLPLLELDPDLCDPHTGAPYSADAARLADDLRQRCVVVAGPGEWSAAPSTPFAPA